MSVPSPWLIVTGDFVRTGGMDVGNYMLARHLAETGCEVHLVAHRVADDLASLPGVHVHLVPKPLNSYLLAAPLLEWYGRRWATRIAQRGGRVVANGGNCQGNDINWIHYVHAAYEPEIKGSLLRRLKMRLQHRKFLADERRCLARAKVIVANSHRTKADLVALLGLPAEKIRVVYYGVEPDAFQPPTPAARSAARERFGWPPHRLKAVFIGALGDRRKGFDILFEAWHQLCADPAWNVDLVVIGVGAELPAWQSRVESDPALNGRIEFLGFRNDVPTILAAVDLLVAPARYEAYGLGVHEALCCGLPAIVSESAGVAERYPYSLKTFLVDDPPRIANIISRLRFWHEARERHATAFVALSQKLRSTTWAAMGAEFVFAAGERTTPHLTHEVETSRLVDGRNSQAATRSLLL
jgi:glycosyltransferase involved in cell wall biosynthesis